MSEANGVSLAKVGLMGTESIVVVAAIALIIGFVVAYYRYSQTSDDFDLKDDLEFIKWLQSYERWYDRSVTWIHWTARIAELLQQSQASFAAV
jgi:hypothetical protein